MSSQTGASRLLPPLTDRTLFSENRTLTLFSITIRTSHSHVSSSSKCSSCFNYQSHAHPPPLRSAHLIYPVPSISPHTSPARTLYHSKRLKDPQTQDVFTSALAKKAANTSHTFARLTSQLLNSQMTPQSFADTANTALSEILQHTAHVVLGKKDPHTPKHEPNKSTAHHTAHHHSSQNPQEAYLQSTIQHHQDAIHILKKDLSLDDPNTLTFHRDKLKDAQDALDKVRKTR